MKEKEIDWSGVPDDVIGAVSRKGDGRKHFPPVLVKSCKMERFAGSLLLTGETESGDYYGVDSDHWDYYERPKEKQFPKAGTKCQVYVTTETWSDWVDCFIVGMDDQGFCVYSLPQEMFEHVGLCYDGESNPENFRPITSETEKEKELIDKVCSIVGSYELAVEVVNCLKDDSA